MGEGRVWSGEDCRAAGGAYVTGAEKELSHKRCSAERRCVEEVGSTEIVKGIGGRNMHLLPRDCLEKADSLMNTSR